jgi:hypothetical protein
VKINLKERRKISVAILHGEKGVEEGPCQRQVR